MRVNRKYSVFFAFWVITLLNSSTLFAKNFETDSIARPQKSGLVNRVLDYFNESNKKTIGSKLNFSILGGPHYSSDTKFGLGLVAAGLYRTPGTDTIMQPSNLSIFADISSVGFYLLGIKGYNFFPGDRFRLNYKVYFYSFSSKFWGIGFENGINDDNETNYKRLQSKVEAEFLFNLGKNWFLGPSAEFCFVDGKHMTSPDLWLGEDLRTHNQGPGLSLSYDTRDNVSNAYKGVYISAQQRFFPKFLGNKYAFSSTELTANTYNRVWKGGIIATNFHSLFTYGNTPWGMLAGVEMRGYYDGRFRDKSVIDATVELRQHVWRRNGVVFWLGAGTVFPEFHQIRMNRILPNAGIGYRWEFKQRMNVRLDFGVGRHSSGFTFNINEAF